MKASEWGEEGTDQIPETYLGQVSYYASLTGVKRVDIAVLIGGQDFRIYTYTSRPELEHDLKRVAKKFWTKHVLAKKPPKLTNLRDASILYPKGNGLEVRANSEVLKQVTELQDLKAREKELTKEIDNLQLTVKKYMQAGEFLVGEDDRIMATWKNSKAKKCLDMNKLKAEHEDIYQECLVEKEGTRTFLLK